MNYDHYQSSIPSTSNQDMESLDSSRIQVGKLPSPFAAPPVDDQPKRPLSSYNIFFQVERQRLISDTTDEGPYSRAEVYSICLDKATRIEKSKRPHRKMHGMISFTDLAKTIAEKWKGLDASQKRLFEERADDEKRKYAVELEEWLLRQAPTQQIKKRLSALRRGSLSKFISSKRQAPSPSPSPSRLPPSPFSDRYLVSSPHGQSPTRAFAPTPSPVEGAEKQRAGKPSRQQIQLQRARNLQRLYQMQIQLYNEQMRLHAECNGELTNPSYESTHYHYPQESLHVPPAGMRLHDTPRYVSSTSLDWERPGSEEDAFMDQILNPHCSLNQGYGLPMPVQSPFHEHVDGRVSPYDGGNAIA